MPEAFHRNKQIRKRPNILGARECADLSHFSTFLSIFRVCTWRETTYCGNTCSLQIFCWKSSNTWKYILFCQNVWKIIIFQWEFGSDFYKISYMTFFVKQIDLHFQEDKCGLKVGDCLRNFKPAQLNETSFLAKKSSKTSKTFWYWSLGAREQTINFEKFAQVSGPEFGTKFHNGFSIVWGCIFKTTK